jgi:hypothetical protein
MNSDASKGTPCSCHHSHARRPYVRSALRRSSVTVVRGLSSVIVDLRRISSTLGRPDGGVRLDELWFASRLPGELIDLSFDFLGDDGFRASLHTGTELSGAHLAKGFINVASRDLFWEATAEFHCAFRVKGVSLIVAADGVPSPMAAL